MRARVCAVAERGERRSCIVATVVVLSNAQIIDLPLVGEWKVGVSGRVCAARTRATHTPPPMARLRRTCQVTYRERMFDIDGFASSARCRARARSSLLCALCLLLATPGAGRAEDDFWGEDKAKHASVSAVLAGAGYAAATPWPTTQRERFAVAMSASLTVGVAKEIYDGVSHTGVASVADLAWDGIGALSAALLALFIDWLLTSEPPRRSAPREPPGWRAPAPDKAVKSRAFQDQRCPSR